jgi:hypothetical protein
MKPRVIRESVPEWSLLKTYRGGSRPDAWGSYCDCFAVDVDRSVSLGAFIEAFYTSPVFRLERWILAALVNLPSTDAQARELAEGCRDKFAAWILAERTETQILLADFRDETRSWLAVVPSGPAEGPRTRLLFGSGIAQSTTSERTGAPQPEPKSQLLMRFHTLYSRVLLHAAKTRLARRDAPGSLRATRH